MQYLVSLLLAGCVLFSASALYANYGSKSWTNVVSQKTANTEQQLAESKKNANCAGHLVS